MIAGAAIAGEAEPSHETGAPTFGFSTPGEQGLDTHQLLELTRWLRAQPKPIFSLLISKNKRVVYELYTSALTRDESHYLMSVTKSVLSSLVGIAIDQRLLKGPDESVVDALPKALFATQADRDRFAPLTIKHVLGMSALDALDPPRDNSPQAVARLRQFRSAPNRTAFALTQAILPEPGVSFQYNDVTPALAAGMVEYASGKTALRFAEQHLFGPMEFKNYEWMHQDPAGIDNGGYGLRLRPIDMQKFGVLFLNHGAWDGRQLVSRAWVQQSFSPWNRSSPELPAPNYGWFWWTNDFGPGWKARVANGWRGQRIAVIPEQKMVVTMTADIEDQTEEAFFEEVMKRISTPLAAAAEPTTNEELLALIAEVAKDPSRFRKGIEERMVPSTKLKHQHHGLIPLPKGP